MVAALDIDQKIDQVHGTPARNDFRYVPGIPELCVPALTVTNGPAGVGPGPQPLGNVPATALPSPLALAATWDPAMARRYGDIQGAEMRSIGRNLLEAPDLDLARVPWNGRTFEAYGEDPVLVSRIGVADIRAIQSHGVIAMAKHYVLNNQEADRQQVDVVVPERALRELYLPPFESAVRAGKVASVMCSYNKVAGLHSCENPDLLTGILKDEWRFPGFVQSDFFATHTAAASANAGLDLEMPNGAFFGKDLRAAVDADQVPATRLDDMLVRRYSQMFRFGIFDRARTVTSIPAGTHSAMARTIAAAGTVLLRNRAGILPFDDGRLRRLAVVGPWSAKAATGGGGTSKVNPIRTSTPIDAIRERAPDNVEVTADSGDDPTRAARVAARADVAIVVVGDIEAEGTDRTSLTLPLGQDALIEAVAAANPNTIVVLHAGAPVLMPWIDRVAAVVEGWYPGGEDGRVTAAVLFGDVEPSGRLPITFPATDATGPATTPDRYPGVSGTVTYDEGLEVGYRWYQAHGVDPLFPFGFGLSYTTFGLADLRIVSDHEAERPSRVTVEVQNTGKRAGTEVVQVYVAAPDVLGEPPKQLRGFTKVQLRAGETRKVSVRLGTRAFGTWDSASQRWTVVPGTYQVLVGTSSTNTPLIAPVVLATEMG